MLRPWHYADNTRVVEQTSEGNTFGVDDWLDHLHEKGLPERGVMLSTSRAEAHTTQAPT